MIGTEHHFGIDLFPCGILYAVDSGDAIAHLQSRFGRRRVWFDPGNHCGLIHVYRIFEVDHVDHGEQADGQQDVHGWPGNGDDETMPAGVRHELGRVACPCVHRVLAAHLDVTAQRNGGDAVIRLASAKPEQTLTKTNGEDFHAHAQQLSGGVVSKFVDQDHESQNHGDGSNGN